MPKSKVQLLPKAKAKPYRTAAMYRFRYISGSGIAMFTP